MTPEIIAGLAGAGLSLGCAYLPKVKDWFGALSDDGKRQTTGLLLALAALGVLLYQCGGYQDACLRANWQDAAKVLFIALTANQSTYTLAVKGRKKAAPEA